MAITATFAADFQKWNEGLRNAQASLKSFELSTVGVKQQLQRMVSGFDGSKIIRDAQVAVAAIDKIGGVAKLTANEQKRMSATVDEALAKYRALGEEAPKDLLAIEHELKNVSAAQKDISTGVDKKAMESLKGLNDGAKESTGAMSLLGSTMKLAFGGAVLGGILAAGKSVLDFGGHLTDLSQQTGIATDDLQTLGVVGKKVGLTMDDIGNAVSQMSRRLAGGDASAVAAVQSLGLNVKQLVDLAPDKAFERIAAAIGEVQNPMERTRLAVELLGKAGAQSLPLLTAELGKLRDAAKDSGEVIDAETVKAMDDLGDSWEDMKTIGAVLLANVMRPMIPVLHAIAEGAKAASAAFSRDLADQSDFLADAWKRLVAAGKDIPGALTNLQVIGFSGQSFDAAAAGANAAAAATANFTAAQKGSISTTDLANNRLKALREEAMAPLTAEQKKLIVELDKFGESNKSIADSVGSNVVAVHLYLDVLKDAAAASKKAGQEAKEAATKVLQLQKAYDKSTESLRNYTATLAANQQKSFVAGLEEDAKRIDKAVTANFRGMMAAQAQADLDLRKRLMSRTAFQISQVNLWATNEKAKIDKSVGNWREWDAAVDASVKQQIASIIESSEELGVVFEHLGVLTGGVFGPMFMGKVETVTKQTVRMSEVTGLLAQGFVNLAQVSGGTFSAIARNIGKLAVGFDNALKGFETFKDTFTKNGQVLKGVGLQMAASIGAGLLSGIGSIMDATSSASLIKNVLGGAAAGSIAGAGVGAAVGIAITGSIKAGALAGGVWGAIAGAAVGIIVGLFRGAHTRALMQQVGREWGKSINEGMAKELERVAKEDFGGNLDAAKLFKMGDILGDVDLDTVTQYGKRLHDVFSTLEAGAFTAAQAQKVLNDNFSAYAEFVTKDGALASQQLLELIKLNDTFATHSSAIKDFVQGQTGNALAGLSAFVTTRGEIAKSLADAQATVNDLVKKHAKSDEIAKAREEVAKFQAQLAAIPLTAGGAEAFGASLFAIFEQLTRDGAPALDVIRQMDPVIASLDQQLKAAGLSGGAAFDSIRHLAGLASDEIAGPAFTAIAGLGSALEGLHNSGLLTQQTFAGIAGEITATYNGLVKQGKGGVDALRLLGKPLQDVWELQQDFHFEVDGATQALLDQAVAAGVVGDKHRSVQEQMLKATQLMSDAVLLLAEHLGVDLPADMQTAADAARDRAKDIAGAFDKVDPTIDVKFNIPKLNLPKPPTVNVPVTYTRPPGPASGGSGGDYGPLYRAAGGPVVSMAAFKASKVSHYLAAGGPVHKAVGALAASALLVTAMPAQAMSPHAGATPAALYAATGTFVAQGTDTVPAMLTPGEYVLPTSVVQKQGLPALEALRSGQATVVPTEPAGNAEHRGAAVRYVTGGSVAPPAALTAIHVQTARALSVGGVIPQQPIESATPYSDGGPVQQVGGRAPAAVSVPGGDIERSARTAAHYATGGRVGSVASAIVDRVGSIVNYLAAGGPAAAQSSVPAPILPARAVEAAQYAGGGRVAPALERVGAVVRYLVTGGAVPARLLGDGWAVTGSVAPAAAASTLTSSGPGTRSLEPAPFVAGGMVVPIVRTLLASGGLVRYLAEGGLAAEPVRAVALAAGGPVAGEGSGPLPDRLYLAAGGAAQTARATIAATRHGDATGAVASALYAASGSFVPQGTDTVPAMLTPGEYVLPTKVVQKEGVPVLDALREGHATIVAYHAETKAAMPTSRTGAGGSVAGYATGGIVLPSTIASSIKAPPLTADLTVTTDAAQKALDAIRKQPPILMVAQADTAGAIAALAQVGQSVPSDVKVSVTAKADGLDAIARDVGALPTERPIEVPVTAPGLVPVLGAINALPLEKDIAATVRLFGLEGVQSGIDTIPRTHDVSFVAKGLPDVKKGADGLPDVHGVTVQYVSSGLAAILAEIAKIPRVIDVAVRYLNGPPGTPPGPTPPLPPSSRGSAGYPLPVPPAISGGSFHTPGGGIGTSTGSGGSFHLARGGLVPAFYAAAGRYIPRGTDTVLAGLTPGEGVLNTRAMAVVGAPLLNQWNRQPESLSRLIETSTRLDSTSGTASVAPLLAPTPVSVALPARATDAGTQSANSARPLQVNFHISALDGADVTRVLKSSETRNALRTLIVSMLAHNESEFRTDVREKAGIV